MPASDMERSMMLGLIGGAERSFRLIGKNQAIDGKLAEPGVESDERQAGGVGESGKVGIGPDWRGVGAVAGELPQSGIQMDWFRVVGKSIVR